jgi:hypothetical protein
LPSNEEEAVMEIQKMAGQQAWNGEIEFIFSLPSEDVI